MSKLAASLRNPHLLSKLTIAMVVLGLGAMFIGSFSYRLSNPSLVKRIQAPRGSDFGNQGGMNTGMTPELMSHIGELMGKLSEDPNSFETRVELAEHFMEVSDWKSATVHLTRALEVNPDSVTANYMMGVTQYSQQDFAASATAFEKIIAIEEDPSAMFNLGILYAQHLGKVDEAKAMFKKVANMDGIERDLKNRAADALERLK